MEAPSGSKLVAMHHSTVMRVTELRKTTTQTVCTARKTDLGPTSRLAFVGGHLLADHLHLVFVRDRAALQDLAHPTVLLVVDQIGSENEHE
jgi:hypothetical protein